MNLSFCDKTVKVLYIQYAYALNGISHELVSDCIRKNEMSKKTSAGNV